MSSASLTLSVSRRVRAIPIGYVYVLLAILGGSIAAVITKYALSSDISPLPLLSTRLLISAALLWLIQLFVFRQRPLLERRLLLGSMAAGVTNAVSLSTFYLALTYIDASIAMVLFATNPIVMLTILMVIGKMPTRLDAARALLAIVGVTLLVGVGGQVAWQGIVLVLITVVLYSVHMLIVQRYLYGYSTAQVTPLFISVMALCVTAASFATTPPADWFSFPPDGWLVIAITAVFSTVLARLALISGIQRIGSGQTALLSPIETLLSVAFAAILIDERLMPLQLVGGALVLISAALVMRQGAVLSTPPPTAQ